jgi:hypothetical protein
MDHRVDLGQRRPVSHQLQGEARGQAAVEQCNDHLGLADRHAPRLQVPLGVLQEPAADEHVHDPHADCRGPTLGAQLEPTRLGGVDPEARGLHEAVQRGIAGVRPGERQGFDDRVLGIGEQRRRAGEAERRRAQAPKRPGPEQHPLAVEPLRVAL